MTELRPLILILDAHEDSRLVYRTFLQHRGYSVFDTADPVVAASRIRDSGVDLLVRDDRLHIDTSEFRIPILTLSCTLPLEAAGAPPADPTLLLKPVYPSALAEHIERALGVER